MRDSWRRLRRPDVILTGILVVFGVAVLWILYVAQVSMFEDVMEDQSKVEAGLVKRTYELEQQGILLREADLDAFLTRQNGFAASAISAVDGPLTQELIDEVIDDYRITGLWIIGADNKVRFGTTPDSEGLDAATFYADFIDTDFKDRLAGLRTETGETWVSPFKLSHHEDGGYMKYAYTAVDLKAEGEVVVVETGASVDELKAKRYGSDRFIGRHPLPRNIESVEINPRAASAFGPREAVKKVAPFTYEVRVVVDDLGGDSMLTVRTHYLSLEKKQHAFFLTFLITSCLMMFVFLTMWAMKERKDYAHWVKESLEKRERDGS